MSLRTAYPKEIDQLMKNYSSQSGLVLIEQSELGPIARLLHSLGHSFKGRLGTDRWASFSRASYSLTTEGERVAEKLADQFSPEDLGVDREYLQDEYLGGRRNSHVQDFHKSADCSWIRGICCVGPDSTGCNT